MRFEKIKKGFQNEYFEKGLSVLYFIRNRGERQ
nr:MAG TPA: hypothetical protein [Caudoviricetes sp.]